MERSGSPRSSTDRRGASPGPPGPGTASASSPLNAGPADGCGHVERRGDGLVPASLLEGMVLAARSVAIVTGAGRDIRAGDRLPLLDASTRRLPHDARYRGGGPRGRLPIRLAQARLPLLPATHDHFRPLHPRVSEAGSAAGGLVRVVASARRIRFQASLTQLRSVGLLRTLPAVLITACTRN